jgi:hypothetical protein
MTLSEFKAWFEGFTEDMDGAPNEKQWKRIKARVKDISGVALTERVFVDRYLPRPWHGYPYVSYATATSCLSAAPDDGLACWTAQNSAIGGQDGTLMATPSKFDGHAAMMMLGKSDFSEVA